MKQLPSKSWISVVTITSVLALTLSGCNAGPTHALKTESTTTTVDPKPADEAAAKKLLIVKSDLPAGWLPSKDENTETEAEKAAQTEVDACINSSNNDDLELSVEGDEFAYGQNNISSSVEVYKSADALKGDATEPDDPKEISCLETAFSKLATSAADDPSVTATSKITKIDGLTTANDEWARRLTITMKGNGRTVVFYVDLLTFFKDRFTTTTTVTYLFTKPPLALEKSLLTSMKAHAGVTTT